VFEDEALADKATAAVEKTIHYGEDEPGQIGERGIETMHLEQITPANPKTE